MTTDPALAAAAAARRGQPSPGEIHALLLGRLASTADAVLAQRTVDVVFDLGMSGRWTLHLVAGEPPRITRGSATRPETVIRTDPATFADVLEARESGAAAFLAGRLGIRGNLALGLQLDGAFTGDRPLTHPRAGIASPIGLRTSYFEAGDPAAPPVVLLHGLGATNASLLPLALGLAETHRVVVPDLPGHGDTAAPNWKYRAADYARWCTAFLRAVGIEHAPIVGNSLGGRVALELALRHPHQAERLVLLCPSPAFQRMRQFVPFVRVLSPNLSRGVPIPMSHRATVSAMKLMFAEPSRVPDSWYDAGADEAKRTLRDAGHRYAFFATMRQIYLEEPHGSRGFWDRLPALKTPALFVWGDKDRLVPAAFARHVVTALPHAESIVMTDCGHVPQFEHPVETLRLTREFIGS